jgi:Ser-tRNA(Ala) deacylase AlaX
MIYAYEREPYRTRLDVQVLAMGEEGGRPYAVLDDTVLYPEGGGQPADRGVLGGVAVVDVQRRDGEVRHYLAAGVVEGPAELALDWRRRFDHMQQHTAQHLLSAIAADRFDWPTTSFHLGERVSDVELEVPSLSPAQLVALEDEVASSVRAARPVRARRVSAAEYAALSVRTRGLPGGHTGDVRLVEIAGIDVTTCGGTHVESTAEIEVVSLLGTAPMRGGTRLYFVAGGRVRRRLAGLEAQLGELRLLLGAPEEELANAARAKEGQLRESQRRGRALEERLAVALADALAARGEPLSDLHVEDAEGGFLQRLAARFEERSAAGAALLTAAGAKGAFFAVVAGSSSGLDVRAAGARVAAILGGRGGGSSRLFQGKAGDLARRGEALAAIAATLETRPDR